MSGSYSGFPGHPGSGAPEMPPLGRPPVPSSPPHPTSPGDDHRVSEPTPLQPRLDAPTDAASGTSVRHHRRRHRPHRAPDATSPSRGRSPATATPG